MEGEVDCRPHADGRCHHGGAKKLEEVCVPPLKIFDFMPGSIASLMAGSRKIARSLGPREPSQVPITSRAYSVHILVYMSMVSAVKSWASAGTGPRSSRASRIWELSQT